MNILIAITNYGTKNDAYLRTILDRYLALPYHVKIVVYTNTPKDWGEGVSVVIAEPPSSNPRSFPFLARRLFIENVDRYDLFIYSEDDMEITSDHITAFLHLIPKLPPHYVPGFLRSEIDTDGNISLPDIHGPFHWYPNSVERFGEYVFADFSNHNMGSYILTQSQLSIVIQSNNYCLLPKRSRYGIIESSVMDVFSDCNLKLMTCISHVEQFLIHHMPNRFIGNLGITKEQLLGEIAALLDIAAGKLPDYSLFETETKLALVIFDKLYYSKCNFQIVKAVGSSKQKNILSVGCGSGETEAEILKNGHQVTAIPLDAVISVTAQAKGIKTLPPNFKEALDHLAGQQFDCIIFDKVLQYLPEPVEILTRFGNVLSPDGLIIANFLNTDCSHWMNERYLPAVRDNPFSPMDESVKDRSFKGLGIHLTHKKNVKSWFNKSGLKLQSLTYSIPRGLRKKAWLSMGLLTPRLSPSFIIIAKK